MTRTAALLGLAAFLGGCGNALVGGDCAPGYVEKDGACVPSPDPRVAGGSVSGSGGGDSGSGGGEVGGGDGGSVPASSGSTAIGVTSSAASTAAGGNCDPPLAACGGSCTDVSTDPSNCGSCGVVCPTDLCEDGVCTGEPVGHVVVVGMDYKKAVLGAPPSVLLANAVFLSWHEPVRVLDYREFSAPGAHSFGVANAVAILADEAQKRSRSIALTTATSAANVPPALASGDFDVLLVHHQAAAPPASLGSIGTSWAAAIDAFAKGGGVIVALASDFGTSEMSDLLTTAGLLVTTDLWSVDGTPLENQGLLDAVGLNVQSPFSAKQHTAAFATTEAEGPTLDYVVVSDQGEPVVVHKIVVGN